LEYVNVVFVKEDVVAAKEHVAVTRILIRTLTMLTRNAGGIRRENKQM